MAHRLNRCAVQDRNAIRAVYADAAWVNDRAVCSTSCLCVIMSRKPFIGQECSPPHSATTRGYTMLVWSKKTGMPGVYPHGTT